MGRHMLNGDRCLDVALPLYAALGGNDSPASPIWLKGGAAASFYITQQQGLIKARFPEICRYATPFPDLDFGYEEDGRCAPGKLLHKVFAALPFLDLMAAKAGLSTMFAQMWPEWQFWADRPAQPILGKIWPRLGQI